MYMKYRITRIFKLLMVSAVIFISLAACQGKDVYKAYEGEAKPANEIATVKIPIELRLQYVDDLPNKGSWVYDTTTIQTLPGKHRFIFYYQIFWEVSSSNAIKVQSKSFALTFDTRAGDIIAINPPAIETLEEAQAFAENPQFTITNQTTDEPVAFEQTTRLEDKGYVASFVESVTKEQPAAAVSSTTAQSEEASHKLKHWWESAGTKQRQNFMDWVYEQKSAVNADASTSPSVAEQEPVGDALETLKYWWDKADASQRQDFMQWVYKQK